MNRVIARLTVVCAVLWSCVDRTGNLDSFTTASVELDIPELVSVDSGIGSASGAENLSKSEKSASEAQKSTIFSEKNRTYSDDFLENGTFSAQNRASNSAISDVVFYIFDENGIFLSKNVFPGGRIFDLDFSRNGVFQVYVLCNLSEFVDLPEAPSQGDLDAMVIPHRESYDLLPFAGKSRITISPGQTQSIRIKIERINSAIKIENRSSERMELTSVTVNGLPNRGNIFATTTEAPGVSYNATAQAEKDAEGNAVVYSFFVPESRIS